MRRYKFRVCILYVRRALVCLCVSACMSIRVRVCVACVVFTFYYMYIVCTTRRWHDYLDWKKVAARSRGAGDPIAIVCLLEEGFYSLSLSFSPFLLFLCCSKVRPSDPRPGRATTVRSSFSGAEPGEKLSDTRLSRPHSVCVSPSVFFFFWL